METAKETRDKIKDTIWKRKNDAIYDEKWAGSDIQRAKLAGIREGLEIAYYLI